MIKYSGHKISFKVLDHLFPLKDRMSLIYGKDSLSSLDVYVNEESIQISYVRRTGGIIRPNSPLSRESLTINGKQNVRTFKINNLI